MQRVIYLLLLLAPVATASEISPKLLFQQNCSACHQMDSDTAGPSLLEIAHLYRNNAAGIAAWALKPGQKRKGRIMPPMSHVGPENLKKIATYMLKITKGKKWRKTEKKAKYTKVSRIQRMFLPDAGPAAIAVRLDDKQSFCWDAGNCRLRYVWDGAYLEAQPYWKGNGNALAKLLGKVNMRTLSFPFTSSNKKGLVKFHGYAVEQGLPVFHYSVDGIAVEEKIKALADGFSIHYKIAKGQAALSYKLKFSGHYKVSCDKSEFAKGLLAVPLGQGFEFTLNFKKEPSK